MSVATARLGSQEMPGADPSPPEAEAAPPVALASVAIAAALAGGAGAWMVGGLFRDPLARGIGFVGVVLGAGLVWAAFRYGHRLALQLLVLPAAALTGAVLLLPDAHAGSSIPRLVTQAIRGGGLLQPPVPFDPGWRFLVVVLCAMVTATAASLAVTAARPKLAIAVPMALLVPAALLQPDSAEIWSASGSIVLIVFALAAARHAELAGEGQLSAEFELNRLARSGALTAGVLALLLVISRAGLLFPATQRDQVVPPHRPQVAAQPPDQVLFTYTASRSVPLRLGTLSVYDGKGWLLPEFDPGRLATVQPGGRFPGAPGGSPSVKVDITLGTIEGRGVPGPAGLVQLKGGVPLQFDPGTQTLRLADRNSAAGLSYELLAAPPPTSKELEAAGAPPKSVADFLKVPSPPFEVVKLLGQAPSDPYDRLQYLRQALYQQVIAEGQGQPVDVPPARVGAMLSGAKASPYEITAAEALLARWAGVPSRIGYGYDGGDKLPDGGIAVHPVNAGTWLEAYFDGHGWVPLVGVPPHAAASLSAARKNLAPGAEAARSLSLVVYVPVRQTSALLLYEELRYYGLRALAVLAVLLLLVVGYPIPLKALRRGRRRRWATGDPRRRIAVAYSEFRDWCRDLAVGDPTAPPRDFLPSLQPDEEHDELAWLVTRALWGDLQRGLRDDDAEAAERMARSLSRRVGGAQPLTTRAVAWVSRASLRQPYSEEVPNLGRWRRRQPGPRRRWRVLGTAAATLALVIAVTAGIETAGLAAPAGDGAQLAELVPSGFGRIELRPERGADPAFTKVSGSVVAAGHVYTVRHDDIVEGSVQVEQLTPALNTNDAEVRQGIKQSLGGGAFADLTTQVPLFDGACLCAGAGTVVPVKHQALHRYQEVYLQSLPDLRVYLWFPPHRNVVVVVALRAQFPRESADQLVLALVDSAVGVPSGPVSVPQGEAG